jgi:hypothetical protein
MSIYTCLLYRRLCTISVQPSANDEGTPFTVNTSNGVLPLVEVNGQIQHTLESLYWAFHCCFHSRMTQLKCGLRLLFSRLSCYFNQGLSSNPNSKLARKRHSAEQNWFPHVMFSEKESQRSRQSPFSVTHRRSSVSVV